MNPRSTSASASYFVAGGALPRGAPSYVRRVADDELFGALCAGELCYVLTPRQMGKSSLMVRTAARLQAAGRAVVVLDLTGVGHNVTADQWYAGLAWQCGRQLGLVDEVETAWRDVSHLGPLLRLVSVLTDVALPHLAPDHPHLVVFIDEIDIVRGLPFSADELFGAIRACVQGRTANEALARVTFCLLGVASPADLISNPDLTPFNVGRRIRLDDFTEEEALALADGLVPACGPADDRAARRAVRAVIGWTGGHPYLTQRVCGALASSPGPITAGSVDAVCRALFLGRESRSCEPNLSFVARRLTAGDDEGASMLTTYRSVLRGRRVASTEASPLVERLLLSGVVRSADGVLAVRNRIYRDVFDTRWVDDHLPGSEVRRQRSAFRRGALRAGALSAAVVALVTALAVLALLSRHAERRASEAAQQALYAADMYLAQQAVAIRDYPRPQGLLDEHVPRAGAPDRRGFEWRYLWGRLHGEEAAFGGGAGLVFSHALSPDGERLACAQQDGTVRIWAWRTSRLVAALPGSGQSCLSVACSPNGALLAAGYKNGQVRLWSMRSWRLLRSWRAAGEVYSVAWRGSEVVLTGDHGGRMSQWSAATGALRAAASNRSSVLAVSATPDGRLAAATDDAGFRLWSRSDRGGVTAGERGSPVSSVALRPDGRVLAVADGGGTVEVWATVPLRRLVSRRIGTAFIDDLAWSSDGSRLAVASWDMHAYVLRADTLEVLHKLGGHSGLVTSAALAPGGERLITASEGVNKVWRLGGALPAGRIRTGIRAPRSALVGGGRTVALLRAKPSLVPLPWGGPPALERAPSIHYSGLRQCRRTRRTAGCRPGAVDIMDESLGVVSTIDLGPGQECFGAAWSPDATRVAVACGAPRRGIAIVDTASHRVVRRLGPAPHTNFIASVAWSPDGRTIVSSSWDRHLLVWDVATGAVRADRGLSGSVYAVDYSPDGRTLASACTDGAVRLWCTATWRELGSVPVGSSLGGVEFTADGRSLVALTEDGGVWWWQAPTLAEIDARRAVPR